MITVFTPTYNRVEKLKNLYESLKNQTINDFEWLIIDDGSTDNTLEYLKSIKKEGKIKINFETQKNSGKHVSFNKGVELAKGNIFICVDSDDILIKNALEKITYYEKKYQEKKIAGFVFLKGYSSNKAVTNRYKEKEFIEDYNEYIINKGFKGDKCEVFYTEVLKKYSFPKLGTEKFLAEGFLWSEIGKKYKYVFIDEIIYICEYLEDGLSKSGRTLRIKNPYGGMYHAYHYLDSYYNIKVRAKNMLLFLTYSKFAGYKGKEKRGLLKMLMKVPSVILFHYWRVKYEKKDITRIS